MSRMIRISDGCYVAADLIAEIKVNSSSSTITVRMKDGIGHCHSPERRKAVNIHELPRDAHVRHPKLPKASWIVFSFASWPCRFKVSKFRVANALSINIWRFSITVRRPWLAASARQLHPELWSKPNE